MSTIPFPTSLRELINHPDFTPFGSSSDDWIADQDRMVRCHDAAEHGCEGSTHAEIIHDWREFLSNLRRDAIRACETDEQEQELEALVVALDAEIDSCEAWHDENGSLHEEIG